MEKIPNEFLYQGRTYKLMSEEEITQGIQEIRKQLNKNQGITPGVTKEKHMKLSKSYFQVAALWHKQSDPFVTGVTETVATIELVKPQTILAASQEEAEIALARMIPNEGDGALALQDLQNVQKFVKPSFR